MAECHYALNDWLIDWFACGHRVNDFGLALLVLTLFNAFVLELQCVPEVARQKLGTLWSLQ